MTQDDVDLKLHPVGRYRHPLSVERHMLYCYALIGQKRRNNDDAFLAEL